ncbi:hypothetical protein E4G67_03725 [Candidatus Bathyarchaeota archaeon]|nr:MAG: hypothetical protein E4G67_03725 [Candidatus Bathyarchaeota archaeon]
MPAFSNPLLIDIVIKAARRINRKLCLFGTDNEITIDPSTGDMLTPDPTTHQALYDMVLLQAECLISSREYQSELRNAGGGVLVRDGEQSVDTRAAGVARGTFYNSPYGPCAELAEWVTIEKMRGTGDSGHLIW